MRRSTLYVALVFVPLVLDASCSRAQGDGVLVQMENGGFEQELATLFEGVRCRIQRTKANTYSGGHACRVFLDEELQWLPEGWGRACLGVRPIDISAGAGRDLVFECFASFNTAEGSLQPILEFHDATGAQIEGTRVVIRSGAEREQSEQEGC